MAQYIIKQKLLSGTSKVKDERGNTLFLFKNIGRRGYILTDLVGNEVFNIKMFKQLMPNIYDKDKLYANITFLREDILDIFAYKFSVYLFNEKEEIRIGGEGFLKIKYTFTYKGKNIATLSKCGILDYNFNIENSAVEKKLLFAIALALRLIFVELGRSNNFIT